jgi:hypothetical protein
VFAGLEIPQSLIKEIPVFKKIALAAGIAVFASSAFAADPSRVYAGGDIGRFLSGDDSSHLTSVGGFVGYKLNDTYAVEGALRRLGSRGNLTVDQAAVSVLATEYMQGEFGNFGFSARLGYARYNADGCDGIYCGKGSFGKVIYGLGMLYNNTNRLTTRFEVQHLDDGANHASIGLIYSF